MGIFDALMLSGSSKDDDEISSVVTLTAVHIADAELGVIWTEDVGGMWSTVHPPVEGANGIG